jgi:hypothetical protein
MMAPLHPAGRSRLREGGAGRRRRATLQPPAPSPRSRGCTDQAASAVTRVPANSQTTQTAIGFPISTGDHVCGGSSSQGSGARRRGRWWGGHRSQHCR